MISDFHHAQEKKPASIQLSRHHIGFPISFYPHGIGHKIAHSFDMVTVGCGDEGAARGKDAQIVERIVASEDEHYQIYELETRAGRLNGAKGGAVVDHETIATMAPMQLADVATETDAPTIHWAILKKRKDGITELANIRVDPSEPVNTMRRYKKSVNIENVLTKLQMAFLCQEEVIEILEFKVMRITYQSTSLIVSRLAMFSSPKAESL